MADPISGIYYSDFTKLPKAILADLINHDNGTVLTPDAVDFGTPRPSGGLRNTLITVTASATSAYTGSVDVQYNRIDLSTIPGIRSTEFDLSDLGNLSDPLPDTIRIADLIPKINAAYQLNLQPEDYIDAVLPAFDSVVPNEVKTFDLVAAPESLIFIGSLTLGVNRGKIHLASIITTVVLNGLNYQQPAP